jgi:hypothetical protein
MKRAVAAWFTLAATAGSLASAEAKAQEATAAVSVHVRYEAVAGCPGEQGFFTQLRARAPRVQLAAPDDEATTFDVAVTREGGRLMGRLFLEERRQATRVSRVAATSCDDVVAALALIAALSIDPRAGEAPMRGSVTASPATAAPASQAPASMATATTAPPTAAPATTPPAATLALPPAPAARDPEPAGPAPALPAAPSDAALVPSSGPPRDRPSRPVSLPSSATGALTHLSTGLDLDSVVYAGVPVLARLGAHVRADWRRGFSLGLGVAASQGSIQESQGGARLQWMTANVEACAFRLPLGAALSVVPCVPVEGGILSVTGTGIPNAVTQRRPWFTVGGLARLELALSARFLVEARAGLAVPLVSDTFYFLPNTDVFRPVGVVGSAGLGVGVRFL